MWVNRTFKTNQTLQFELMTSPLEKKLLKYRREIETV